MPNRFLTHAVRASLLALVAATVGCDGRSPSGPTPPPPTPSSGPTSPPAVAAPRVSSIVPNVGNSTGGTVIDINGSGFQVGAKVTLDGTETPTYPIDSSAVIRLPVPPHRSGSVDVAVINPDGQSAQLIGEFRISRGLRTSGFDGASTIDQFRLTERGYFGRWHLCPYNRHSVPIRSDGDIRRHPVQTKCLR